MEYQYKLIVSNQTFYKEFEISADLEKVKLGTTSNCEFRLNPDFFFENIEIEFEKRISGIFSAMIMSILVEAMFVNYCFRNCIMGMFSIFVMQVQAKRHLNFVF